MFLCSADGHVGAPTAHYKCYLEKRYHQAFDEYLAKHKWLWSPAKPESLLQKSLHERMAPTEGFEPDRGTPVVWDPHRRLREYDKDGILAEVLVPDDQNSNDPPFGSGLATAAVAGSHYESYPPEWQRIGARAYYRWLAEFCAADSKRLRGLTALGTLADVDWCIEEIYRSYKEGLTTGILLPLEYYLPLYHHPRYDPLWETLQELDMTVVSHVSKGGPDWVGDDPRTIARIWFAEAVWFAQRPLWCLMLGGIFERFPRLRLSITELRAGWCEQLITSLDMLCSETGFIFTGAHSEKFKLTLSAREYFERQVYVAYSGRDLIKREVLQKDNFPAIPNMVWGSDLGHGEGFWPSGKEELRTLVSGLSEENMRSYLGEKIVKAYPKIVKNDFLDLMERIAPTAGELGLVKEEVAA
jgi:predicted TIM-barrel fold metal-dependent hydrolase